MKISMNSPKIAILFLQKGSSLIVVLIMLTVIMTIGLVSAKMSLFGERSARNDRDRQIAFQSAEAALLDAELDIFGPNSAANRRVCVFDSKIPSEFVEGCGTLTKTGMCLNTASPSNAWKSVLARYTSETGDSSASSSNKTVQFGQFTGQTMPNASSGNAGLVGGVPVRLPRYTVEAVRYAGTGAASDNVGSSTTSEYAFLVTAMGFGTRMETQVMLQALLYKPANKPGSGC
jgi:type IV pilus assembly protein PilX